MLKVDKKILTVALIGSIFPDVDIPLSLVFGRGFHRGPTHSIVGILILAVVLGLIFYKKSFKSSFRIGLLALSTHPLLDSILPWPIEWFWPFYNEKIVTLTMFSSKHYFFFYIYLIAVGIILALTYLLWKKKRLIPIEPWFVYKI